MDDVRLCCCWRSCSFAKLVVVRHLHFSFCSSQVFVEWDWLSGTPVVTVVPRINYCTRHHFHQLLHSTIHSTCHTLSSLCPFRLYFKYPVSLRLSFHLFHWRHFCKTLSFFRSGCTVTMVMTVITGNFWAPPPTLFSPIPIRRLEHGCHCVVLALLSLEQGLCSCF